MAVSQRQNILFESFTFCYFKQEHQTAHTRTHNYSSRPIKMTNDAILFDTLQRNCEKHLANVLILW